MPLPFLLNSFLYACKWPHRILWRNHLTESEAIIVAYNHPSGNLDPSPKDRDVTLRLRQAGDVLGIKVLDHLIFCEEGFLSMLEGGVF